MRPVVEAGGSASRVFAHKRKARAIDDAYTFRARRLGAYLAADDKIAYLRKLPFIGATTVWRLAASLGTRDGTPDPHVVRLAGDEGVARLCARLAAASDDAVATVATVLRRAANLGLV